jgi:hypothetical protein
MGWFDFFKKKVELPTEEEIAATYKEVFSAELNGKSFKISQDLTGSYSIYLGKKRREGWVYGSTINALLKEGCIYILNFAYPSAYEHLEHTCFNIVEKQNKLGESEYYVQMSPDIKGIPKDLFKGEHGWSIGTNGKHRWRSDLFKSVEEAEKAIQDFKDKLARKSFEEKVVKTIC